MRVVRVSAGGKRVSVSPHSIKQDDTVGSAATKLAALSGNSSVYMWCDRAVSPHDAFGILFSDPDATPFLVAKRALSVASERGAGQAQPLSPLRLPDKAAASKQGILRHLESLEGRLFEKVSMRSRYAVPGAYFLSDGVDPWAGPSGLPEADAGLSDRAQAINFSNLLVENFGLSGEPEAAPGEDKGAADKGAYGGVIYYTTREDLLKAKPVGTPDAAWEEHVLDRYTYRDDRAADLSVIPWSKEADANIEAHRAHRGARQYTVTYLKVSGGVPHGCPLSTPTQWAQQFLEFFASAHTSPGVPYMRLGHRAVRRHISKRHSSLPGSVPERVKAPEAGEYLQFAIRSGDDIAVLTLNGFGNFSMHVSFRTVDQKTPEGVVADFGPAATAVLREVSPFYPPVDESCLRSRSTSYQKGRLTNHPRCVMEVSAEAPSPRPPERVMRMAAAARPAAAAVHLANFLASSTGRENKVWPVLRGVNVRDGRTAHLQYMRAPNVTLKAVVQGIARFTGSAQAAHVFAGTARDFGVPLADLLAVAASRADFMSTLPSVSVSRASDTRAAISMKYVADSRYIARAIDAVNAGAKQSSGASAAGDKVVAAKGDAADSAVKGLSFAKGASQQAVRSAAVDGADLDEYFDIIDDAADDGVIKATATSEQTAQSTESTPPDGAAADNKPADNKPADNAADDDASPGQSDDVLNRLKRIDPAVFAQPPTKGFGSYSVKCQKGKQPVALTDAELARASAEKRSSAALSKAPPVRFGSAPDKIRNYVCPEKWCVTSGVARAAGQPCPDPKEMWWSFADEHRYPGFLPGIQHPKGLCMPCCYRKPPREGSVMADRARACEASSAVQGDPQAADGAPIDSGPRGARLEVGNGTGVVKGVRPGNAHVNRADRILDLGALGEIPREFGVSATEGRRGGGGGGGGGGVAQAPREPREPREPRSAVVRVGLGLDSTLSDALGMLADAFRPEGREKGGGDDSHRGGPGACRKPVARLCADLAEALTPTHFMQTWAPRMFADRSGSGPGSRGDATKRFEEDAARFARDAGYRALVASTKGKQQARRDEILAGAYAAYLEALRKAANGSVESAAEVAVTLFGAVNTGALAWLPPVHLLALGPQGAAYAEHAPSRALVAGEDACVVLSRNGVFEPAGVVLDMRRSDVLLRVPGSEAWLEEAKEGIRRHLPAAGAGGVRTVGYCMLAVGQVDAKGRFLPYSSPVPIDAGAGTKHAYIDGVSAASPLADARPADADVAAAAAERTGATDFYPPSHAWKAVAARALSDDVKDGAIFTGVSGGGGDWKSLDKREASLAWIKDRLAKADKIASAVLSAVREAGGDHLLERRGAADNAAGPDDLLSDSQATDLIVDKYWPAIKAAVDGATRDDARYAVTNIVRPVPSNYLPYVAVGADETLSVS